MEGTESSARRPAYAIFAGGGVKGAAFAGCLKAAEEYGFEFRGYGGTSAGSLIALLACVGYTADELRLLTEEVPFASLMDDGGRGVKRLMEMKDGLGFGFGTARDLIMNAGMLNTLRTKLGLYDGMELRSFLRRMILRKLPSLADKPNITFQDLHDAGCPALKILASNITLRRDYRFPDGSHGGQNDYAIDAVRTSVSYPFVFQPERVHDRHLVDGGLSANLPFFLFEEERKDNPLPVFAFDLVTDRAPRGGGYGLMQFSGDLLSTALESSQELQRGQMLEGPHIYIIPVKVSVDTFDLELTAEQRRELFEAGHAAARKGLADFSEAISNPPGTHIGEGRAPEESAPPPEERLRNLSKIDYLRALHAPPRLVLPLLEAMIAEFRKEMDSDAELRAYVLLRYDKDTLFVAYQRGVDKANLELDIQHGWGGAVWDQRLPIIMELGDSASLGEQYASLASSQKSLLAAPMFHYERVHNPPLPLAGVLCIDSNDASHARIWSQEMKFVMLARRWSDIISRILS